MDTPEEAAKRIFGQRASLYTTSASHTDPQVLARVVELAAPASNWTALDVATGAGHTAFALAPYVHAVVATDLTPEMLAEAERLRVQQSIANVTFHVANVHHLPFPDEAFDLLTCRRAAHHFSNIMRALGEMWRVLCPGGRLVIDDRSVPEDGFVDACMNQLDRLHDESHVRQYRASEWRQMLATARFSIDVVEPYDKLRPLSALTTGVSPENVRRIRAVIDRLDPHQRERMNVVDVDGDLHLNHWYVLIAAKKR